MENIFNILVFSVTGQVLMQGNLSDETTTINVEHLSSGVYFIKVGILY